MDHHWLIFSIGWKRKYSNSLVIFFCLIYSCSQKMPEEDFEPNKPYIGRYDNPSFSIMLSVEVADAEMFKDFTPIYMCLNFDDHALDKVHILKSSSAKVRRARENILSSWEKENYYIYKARQMIVEQWEREEEQEDADQEMN